MSKVSYLKRYICIIQQLHKKSCTYEELEQYLQKEFQNSGLILKFGKRTLQRDIGDIASLFGINIYYNFKKQHYSIEDTSAILHTPIIDAFNWINLVSTAEKMKPYIAFEGRKTIGTEHIANILHAINTKRQINIEHQKFLEQHSYTKIVEPLGVKQSQYRWYLVAKDNDAPTIKTYGLERILSIKILNTKFTYPKDFNLNNYFKDFFGVITDATTALPKRVVLHFEPQQAKYIESLPIHSSQKELQNNKEGLTIELHLHITFDFIRELLSYGNMVNVIHPKSLIKELDLLKT